MFSYKKIPNTKYLDRYIFFFNNSKLTGLRYCSSISIYFERISDNNLRYQISPLLYRTVTRPARWRRGCGAAAERRRRGYCIVKLRFIKTNLFTQLPFISWNHQTRHFFYKKKRIYFIYYYHSSFFVLHIINIVKSEEIYCGILLMIFYYYSM